MSTFTLRVADLTPGLNRVHLEAPATGIGLDAETWPELLVLDLDVDRMGEQFALRGTVRASSREECARCLEPFEAPRDFEFQAYAELAAGTRNGDDDVLGEYVLRHDGRALVLDDELREQALLARPMTSLCRPDCPGLCPRCGAKLGEVPCACGDRGEPAT
jgi:uncharacterized protein